MRSTPPVNGNTIDTTPDPDDLMIRPSTLSDIEDFYELARLAGAGFTSLPANEAVLADRLTSSERAFAGEPGILTLALEDLRTNTVVGCAAIKPGGTPRPDFLNFLASGDGLVPTERYADMTEVGSLLLHPDYRSNGIGPWLARSRYLLIANDPERFGTHIFSELRGVVDESDRSPFYDAVCAPYFGCSFAEADDLCAHGRQGELNRLLPTAPIDLANLSAEALTAMGQPHRAGRRALDYLEAEGFHFEGVVDLLDGGPAVAAATRAVRTIEESFEARMVSGVIDEDDTMDAYVAVGAGADYRCCRTALSIDSDGTVELPNSTLLGLGIPDGARGTVRLVDRVRHPVAAKVVTMTPSAVTANADVAGE